MEPSRWKLIDELLDAALDLPESERERFIAEHCKGDTDLQREVFRLLAAQKESDNFLDNSAMRVAAAALADENPFTPEYRFVDKQIAHYRTGKLLGAGGMGEVYLAVDQKLQRNVALKVLPPEFISNDERVLRFAQEARAISSLNHPNIVTVYDVGNFDGVNYIATEFVEGKNLRELMTGSFKLRNILLNSIQICDALSAAHNAGIIHRDIKPENIMIRKDGYAKILDFGLAKLTDTSEEKSFDLAKTTKGTLIGTPAYMSPSQISGDVVDHRTDLWSCGVVLYEFLTGSNPFKRPSRTATFHAIMTDDPVPPSSVKPDLPEELDRVLAKALEKDRDMGYQSAADLRADLKRVLRILDSSQSLGLSSGSFKQQVGLRSSVWELFIAGTGAALLTVFAGYFLTRPSVPSAAAAEGIDWTLASSSQLTNSAGTEYYPSLSPDGKSLVYAGQNEGNFDVYLQRVGGKNAVNLTDDHDGDDTQPVFSPDGENIAFRSDRDGGGIFVMGSTRENLRRIADFGYHPSWSPDGTMLVVSTFGRDRPTVRENGEHGLWTINVRTGEKREIFKGLASFPAWSPDGSRIAYWYYGGTVGRSDIASIPAGGGEPVSLTDGFGVLNWNPVWSPDGKYIYFVSNRGGNQAFWRVRVESVSGKALTEPEPVVTPSKFSRHVSFSRDGKRMVYVQTDLQSNIQGVPFDAQRVETSGEPFWITEGDREVTRAELSPDGTKFQMRQIRRTHDDIVTVSRDGREWRDVTDDEPFDRFSRWSPDGSQIAFSSDRSGIGEVWVCDADGTNLRQLTFKLDENYATGFPVWSPDGRRLSFTNNTDAYILDLSKPWDQQTPEKLPRAEDGNYYVPWDWSPDGKKLAVTFGPPNIGGGYISLETKRTGRFTKTSGSIASWLPDSRHLVYAQGNSIFVTDIDTLRSRKLLSVPVGQPRSPFVSRDGTLLYYVVHRGESDIWLLDLTEEK